MTAAGQAKVGYEEGLSPPEDGSALGQVPGLVTKARSLSADWTILRLVQMVLALPGAGGWTRCLPQPGFFGLCDLQGHFCF